MLSTYIQYQLIGYTFYYILVDIFQTSVTTSLFISLFSLSWWVLRHQLYDDVW